MADKPKTAPKGKSTATKTSKKPVKPTSVKAPAKSKKPVAKTTKKTTKKKAAPKKPVITEAMYEKWLFSLEAEYFAELCKEWNQKNLKLKIPALAEYDDWLNYFKTLSPNAIRVLATTGQDFLPTDGYAALRRWHDILANPHRIDKIHQSGLTKPKDDKTKSIVELAKNNDRMGMLCAIRDRLADKLEKGAGARDTASLAREMGEILDQIAELEKRMGPKKGTKVNQLLGEFDVRKTRSRDKGARNTSFKSRVTIDDMEAK